MNHRGASDRRAGIPRLEGSTGEAVIAGLRRSAALGFVGPVPTEQLVDHSIGFAMAIEGVLGRPPRSLLDLGTGGGPPGLVLCAIWTEARVLLVDANERRTDFLNGELDRAGFRPRAEVRRGRAEELGHDLELRQKFEAVTSRSFGRPAVTAECGAPFVVVGGVLVVSEPPEGGAGGRWSDGDLATLGLAVGPVVRPEGRNGYQVLRKSAPTPDRFPRRVGTVAKRPLF